MYAWNIIRIITIINNLRQIAYANIAIYVFELIDWCAMNGWEEQILNYCLCHNGSITYA